MILLDTNVLSELARENPAPTVLAWARTVPVSRLCTTAITESELRFGVAILPPGRRRTALEQATEAILHRVVQDRVLPFDRSAARYYAALAADRRRRGRPVDTADLQIQAIARACAVQSIATRDTAHFAGCGVPLVDPWQAT